MIVPMKRAVIICMKENKEKLLRALQKTESFMLINDEDKTASSYKDESITTKQLLKELKDYSPKKSIFSDKPCLEFDEFLNSNESYEILKEKCKQSLADIKNLKEKIKNNTEILEKLLPWKKLDAKIEDIKTTEYSSTKAGIIPKKKFKTLKKVFKNLNVEYKLVGKKNNDKLLIFSCFIEDLANVQKACSEASFKGYEFPLKSGKIQENIKNIKEKINLLNKELKEKEENLKKLAEKSFELEILFERQKAKAELESINCSFTSKTVYLEGWIKAKDQKLIQNVAKQNDLICDAVFFEPKPTDKVPTVVENNKFTKQFEVITDMFSIPSYKSVDPNPLMAIWYWVIFGLMVADAGYGIVMLLGCLGLIKLIKPAGNSRKLINTIALSSFTTMFWGIMFGSYFGVTWHPIMFSPLESPIKLLIFSLVIGVFHIFSGMMLNIYECIRSKRFLDAIFDELTWVFIITGLGLLFFDETRQVGIYMAAIPAVVILFTAGRKSKNFFGKISSGFTKLYSITSYVSDILSYSRILALSLATGVVAMVMNMLAQMLPRTILGVAISLLIYIIGHIFNLALGLLSAYVHDSRLQYIEFFNKFYKGGGIEFKPLAVKPSYINIKK